VSATSFRPAGAALSPARRPLPLLACCPESRARPDGHAIRPFRVDAKEGELIALRRPATATPWPHPETTDRSQRAQLAKIQEPVGYWGTDYRLAEGGGEAERLAAICD
jgi:hypothetical protein